jgi:hypothetical protein
MTPKQAGKDGNQSETDDDIPSDRLVRMTLADAISKPGATDWAKINATMLKLAQVRPDYVWMFEMYRLSMSNASELLHHWHSNPNRRWPWGYHREYADRVKFDAGIQTTKALQIPVVWC